MPAFVNVLISFKTASRTSPYGKKPNRLTKRARNGCFYLVKRKTRRAYVCIMFSKHIDVLADERHQRKLVGCQAWKRGDIEIATHIAELLIASEFGCDSGNGGGV